ncbi:MAG: M48 family metallopeptidase [Endomicrobium sp.]|jgi:heat shock protein HtpX|nr:M48 family metallopeptidase [Endomicrobium sp.]
MAKITTYDFIDSTKRKTVLLMVLFPVSLVIVVYLVLLLVGGFSSNPDQNNVSALDSANSIAIIVLPLVSIISIIWVLISYYFGQNFILHTAGAKQLTSNTSGEKEILRIVENIAITAGLPMPKVYAINDDSLNAFATGRDPKHSYVVLTKGIINRLEKSELEGVIAHEMSHIGNRDIRLMLIMVACISVSTIVAEILLRMGLSSRSKNSKNNNGQIIMIALAAAFYIHGYLVAPLIQLAVSRTREFQADATAALITRNPAGLANALRKISRNSTVKTLNDKQTISALCIANPLAADKKDSLFAKLSGLYATHPPIEERIKALETMDGYRS